MSEVIKPQQLKLHTSMTLPSGLCEGLICSYCCTVHQILADQAYDNEKQNKKLKSNKF
jgi:hypothetical protein